jgi:hypothetical protein
MPSVKMASLQLVTALKDATQKRREGRLTYRNRYSLSDLITVTLQEQWEQILRPALHRNIHERR